MRVIMSMNVLMPSWSYLLLMSNVLFKPSLARCCPPASTTMPYRPPPGVRVSVNAYRKQRAVGSRGTERRGAHEKRLPTAAAPVAHVERRIARIAQPLIGGRELRSARARCLDDGARDGARADAERTRVCRPVGAKPVAPRLRILGR